MDDLPSSLSGPDAEPDTLAHAVPRLQQERRGLTPSSSAAVAGDNDERVFLELRRKVQSCSLLSAATEKLLGKMKFNGHLTVVVQHGCVVKTGYEEGYFRRRNDLGGVLFETS